MFPQPIEGESWPTGLGETSWRAGFQEPGFGHWNHLNHNSPQLLSMCYTDGDVIDYAKWCHIKYRWRAQMTDGDGDA